MSLGRSAAAALRPTAPRHAACSVTSLSEAGRHSAKPPDQRPAGLPAPPDGGDAPSECASAVCGWKEAEHRRPDSRPDEPGPEPGPRPGPEQLSPSPVYSALRETSEGRGGLSDAPSGAAVGAPSAAAALDGGGGGLRSALAPGWGALHLALVLAPAAARGLDRRGLSLPASRALSLPPRLVLRPAASLLASLERRAAEGAAESACAEGLLDPNLDAPPLPLLLRAGVSRGCATE